MRYCCDQECEQGRHCPNKPQVVRAPRGPFVMGVCAVAAGLVVVAIVAAIPRAPSNPCGVAEFSPDVPVHVKEQCRQHRRIKT